MGSPGMFAYRLDRTLGALNELGYHLSIARAMGLVAEDAHREMEGLRGRATFYTMKPHMSLIGDPRSGSAAPP